MPVLANPRHERFAQELAKGKSADEAYQAAGFKPHRGNASTLRANQNVKARLAELQSKAADRAVVTVEDIARQLDEDREFARENGSAAAAVTATMGKAKVLGLITDKSESTVTVNDAAQREADAFKSRIAGLAARTGKAGNSRRLDG